MTSHRYIAKALVRGAIGFATLGAVADQVQASVTVPVEASVCSPRTVFAGGFEPQWVAQSSAGSGGSDGAVFRNAPRPGQAPVGYYAYVPTVRPHPAPAIVVMHGAAGAGNAPLAAQQTRDDWIALAQTAGVIVIAPIASGAQGGWNPGADFPAMDAVLADAQAAYSIDLTRRYLWGFSAGGHVAHALALLRNNDRYAAYAVHAGVLDAYAGGSAAAQAARQVPLTLWIGDQDSLFPFAETDRGRFLNAGWTEGSTLDYRPFADGHTYYVSQLSSVWQFMCAWSVQP